MNNKIDPIRDKYFAPLEMAEQWSERLFYTTAVVSVAALLVDGSAYPAAYAIVQIAFATLAIAGVILGLAIRFYWAPRGTEKRISDFISSAFSVNLTSERTEGYYNNTERDPIRKAALQLLENSWFTKEIARLMCVRRRIILAIYGGVWLIALVSRDMPIDFVLVVCQVLFSEEVISSFIRLEWLRTKSEKIFDAMFRSLSVRNLSKQAFAASVVEFLVCYESHKAASNVTLSSDVFNANNARLSTEWDQMRATLEA